MNAGTQIALMIGLLVFIILAYIGWKYSKPEDGKYKLKKINFGKKNGTR